MPIKEVTSIAPPPLDGPDMGRRILEANMDVEWQDIVILGMDENNEFLVAHSAMSPGHRLLLLEYAKQGLLESLQYEDDDE